MLACDRRLFQRHRLTAPNGPRRALVPSVFQVPCKKRGLPDNRLLPPVRPPARVARSSGGVEVLLVCGGVYAYTYIHTYIHIQYSILLYPVVAADASSSFPANLLTAARYSVRRAGTSRTPPT
jgi:hypothetical protein